MLLRVAYSASGRGTSTNACRPVCKRSWCSCSGASGYRQESTYCPAARSFHCLTANPPTTTPNRSSGLASARIQGAPGAVTPPPPPPNSSRPDPAPGAPSSAGIVWTGSLCPGLHALGRGVVVRAPPGFPLLASHPGPRSPSPPWRRVLPILRVLPAGFCGACVRAPSCALASLPGVRAAGGGGGGRAEPMLGAEGGG